jgi:hypothetical protein
MLQVKSSFKINTLYDPKSDVSTAHVSEHLTTNPTPSQSPTLASQVGEDLRARGTKKITIHLKAMLVRKSWHSPQSLFLSGLCI